MDALRSWCLFGFPFRYNSYGPIAGVRSTSYILTELLDPYAQAATSSNTARPITVQLATAKSNGGLFACYCGMRRPLLVQPAETLLVNMPRQRPAALAQWHLVQGFPSCVVSAN